MNPAALPATLVAKRDRLEARLAEVEGARKVKLNARREMEKKGIEEDPSLGLEIGELLKLEAKLVDILHDLERPNIILLHEKEEREAREAKDGTPKEGTIELEADPAPTGLEAKSLEEIIHVLREKQKWTYQQVVDYMHANGIKKKRGGEKWNTSDVYAIHQRGFKPA